MFKTLMARIQLPQPNQLFHISVLQQPLRYQAMRPSLRLPRRVATFFANEIRREGRNDSLERGMPEPDFYASMMFGPVESEARLRRVAREIAQRRPAPLPSTPRPNLPPLPRQIAASAAPG